MRILVEAVMPQTCYLDEAVFWISFGCVPYSDLRSDPAARLSEVEAYEGGTSWLDVPGALRSRGIEVDVERYYRAPDESTLDRYLAARAKWRSTVERLEAMAASDPEGVAYTVENFDLETEREAVDLQWARDLEAALETDIDLGRVRLFQELASGSIGALGFLFEEDGSTAALEHSPIPRDAWRLAKVNWQSGVLALEGGREFRNVQVKVDDLLTSVPRPTVVPSAEEDVANYGACYIIEESSGGNVRSPRPEHRRPNRGAPPKGALSAREVALNYFSRRILERIDGDSEALIAEIMDFVLKSCRETVARSTVQDWIRLHRRASLTEIMPGNRTAMSAGK